MISYQHKPIILFLKNLPYKKNSKPAIRSLSDEELISIYCKASNKEVIGILFDRYIHLVFASCMKYLKNEDQAQDTAMEVFESLPDKIAKHQINSFKSWLYVTTKNHCLMLLRKKKTVEHIDFFENLAELSVEFSEQTHLTDTDTEKLIRKHLSKLRDEQRICVELMYLKGLSYQAISDETGLKLKSVKSHIQNGKRNLKISLEKFYEQQE